MIGSTTSALSGVVEPSTRHVDKVAITGDARPI
jgi:hypothetical protein